MPRLSPEARSALYHRTGKAPAPPAHLDAKAKRLWREITHSRPVDFFLPGQTVLLEQFVELAVLQRFYLDMLKRNPLNPELLKSTTMLATTLNMTAQKLRISNSAAIVRKSGIYDETDTKPADAGDNVTTLFGGGRVRF
jgi:hypothetical protein